VVSPLPCGPGLSRRQVAVATQDVAFVRYLLEAHDGLAFMHGDGSGVISLLTPDSQLAALDRLIADLSAEGALRVL
jgi:hypothetical protein